jgi:hypothetical protein
MELGLRAREAQERGHAPLAMQGFAAREISCRVSEISASFSTADSLRRNK